MAIQWNALAGGGFQNALATGLQLGQVARQQQDRRDERNALAAFVKNPSGETAAAVAPFNPQLAYQYGQDQRAAQVQQVETGLAQRALAGDEAALAELATVNFDKWKSLNPEIKARAREESELYGQAALDLLQVPYAQRRDRVIAYSQRFPEIREQIEEIAYLPQAEQETALRAVVIDARMVGKLHDMEQPQAFNVGPGEGRYERNPRTGAISTIVQPNYGNAAPFSPVAAPTPEQIDAELRRRGVIR
jgi:hypothetical protein